MKHLNLIRNACVATHDLNKAPSKIATIGLLLTELVGGGIISIRSSDTDVSAWPVGRLHLIFFPENKMQISIRRILHKSMNSNRYL